MNHPRTLPFVSALLDPEREVMDALNSADDQRLWRVLRRVADEDRLLQAIAEDAPRLSRGGRSGARFSEMLLVPVIESAGNGVVGNPANWKPSERCFSEAMSQWLGGTVEHTIFRGVVPYELISGWEPSTLREHLLATGSSTGRGPVTLCPERLVLPDGLPRLGFVVSVMTDRTGWPQLPEPNTLQDARFKEVVAHALSASAKDARVEVLAPDQVSAALVDGLCLWLSTVHNKMPILTWDVSPSRTRHDSVDVVLTLEEDDSQVQFTVRRHQVASVGVDCIAMFLAAIAPRSAIAQVH